MKRRHFLWKPFQKRAFPKDKGRTFGVGFRCKLDGKLKY